MFEGYTGISLVEGQPIHDILLFALIILIAIFAFAFYTSNPLFEKMIHGFVSVKERHNLFNTPTQESIYFDLFMGFQTMFLCTVFIYLAISHFSNIQMQTVREELLLFFTLFVILTLFYLLKRFLYFIFGRVFVDKGKFTLWNSTYHALFSLWGVALYLPVLWIMLDKESFTGAIILFLGLFAVFRIITVYVKIRIFYHKNNGLLFFNSYLCAQEIIPLLFLYECLAYLYNIIGTSIIWQ
ncbi:MAG: DUF4271 domain-containing protein [Tannerella sp.]|jgi:hypothetical protein|nr:DUF4271 domain-containing protein [Tannerella sp.]